MLKYTRAMILRTGMQIEQAVRLAQTVSLFTAILPPLCQILTQKGVFLRNLILLLCGLGFAIFTLIANANSKITKKYGQVCDILSADLSDYFLKKKL